MMIESLESRSLMSVDLSLKTLTSTLPPSVETTALSKLKGITAKVTLVNSGSEALPKTLAPVEAKVFLKSSSGVETLIGTVKAAKYGGLKSAGTKNLTAKCTIPTTLAKDTYTLEAKIDTTAAVTESDETNNTVTGNTTQVVAGGNALFATYRFADSMTFTRTQDDSGNGTIGEEGTWVDANGVTGGYIYAVSAAVFGRRSTTITLFRQDANRANETYIANYVGKVLTTTLNGKHAAWSAKGNGGVKVYGSPTAAGVNVFVKIT